MELMWVTSQFFLVLMSVVLDTSQLKEMILSICSSKYWKIGFPLITASVCVVMDSFLFFCL